MGKPGSRRAARLRARSLLEKLLARRREDRFASADDMLDYITRVWGVPRAKIFEFEERGPESG